MLEDDILKRFPSEISKNEAMIAGIRADMQTLAAHPHPKDGFAGMTIHGHTYTEKGDAGGALLDAVSKVTQIPSFMATFVYDFRSPTYQANEDIWDRLFAESEQPEAEEYTEKDLYLENISLLSCFDSPKWDGFTVKEKITIMQALVNFESEQLGIPRATCAGCTGNPSDSGATR